MDVQEGKSCLNALNFPRKLFSGKMLFTRESFHFLIEASRIVIVDAMEVSLLSLSYIFLSSENR